MTHSTHADAKAPIDWKYLLTTVEGRIGRKTYWIGTLAVLVIGALIQLLVASMAGETAGLIAGLIFLLPGFAIGAKRSHDRNRPAWILLLFYVPATVVFVMNAMGLDMDGDQPRILFVGLNGILVIVMIWLTIELGFLRGTPGTNRYGPDPLAGR
jgi:uncharacterized membrane protein YhaH (DUF805 family)